VCPSASPRPPRHSNREGPLSLPQRALKPCPVPGCPALTPSGKCPLHRTQADTLDRTRRGTAAQRGYGARWAAYSREYRDANPWCTHCGTQGHRSLAQCVDHITPVSGPTDPLFWDRANHQGLCWSCHSRKTAIEDHRGIGRTPNVDKRRNSYPKKTQSTYSVHPHIHNSTHNSGFGIR
jgi:5-methylcytosine-specific restriction protein A